MKGLVVVLVGFVITAGAGATEVPSDATEGAGGLSTADISGAGRFVFPGTFRVWANDDPLEDSGVLHVTYLLGGPAPQQFIATLDCVKIVENTAIVSGIVTHTAGTGYEEGQRVWFGLADRGTVTDQPADGLTGYGPGTETETETCESFQGPFFSFVNVGAGDISINGG